MRTRDKKVEHESCQLIFNIVSGSKTPGRSEAPEILILDEPTNNLDLVNVEFLEKVVAAFTGAVIVVSHDETFLKNAGILDELRLPGR